MKKLLSIAFAAGSMAALADTTITGQAIGSITVESTLTNTIVAVAFNELSPIANQQISVSNIVNAADLAVGDKVYVLVNGSSYQGWTLTQGDNYKYWAKNENTFSLNAGGQQEQGTGASADEIRPAVGTGIWLQRGSNWNGNKFSFHVYGAVPGSKSTTVAAGKKTLFGNPTNAAASPTVDGASSGDIILVPTDAAPLTVTYTSKSGWNYRKDGSRYTGIPQIAKGTGAWYVSKGSSNVTISWN